MPTTAHTRRQNHGTRGTFRDRVLDWQATSEVSASNHLVVTLSDLGIKNLRPTKKELTKAANKLLELALEDLGPSTVDFDDQQDSDIFTHEETALNLDDDDIAIEEDDFDDIDGTYWPNDPQDYDSSSVQDLFYGDLDSADSGPSDAVLPTRGKIGFRSDYQNRTADNGLIRDWEHLPEDDPFNGSDRPMSGFHFFTP